jgi:hypothetical protein
MARIQYIQRYPTRNATNPKITGASGTPMVTMEVQIPIYRALSCWKKVSETTPLPMEAAGLMKKPVMARQSAMVPYE